MRLKTVHIRNCTKVFWKRVPEPWRCYHNKLYHLTSSIEQLAWKVKYCLKI